MRLLNRWFGSSTQPAPAPSELRIFSPAAPPPAQGNTRRELLRVVLRDTMVKHGIPTTWLGAETLVSDLPDGQAGLHLRLLVRQWEPRLLAHGVAFQQSFCRRLTLFDPVAAHWLTGISWQYDLPDPAVCPDMPDPKVWTSSAAEPVAVLHGAQELFEPTQPVGL
jgi:hypothetical protein